uniref:Disease resistance R13L4/SHOC-2-like LRR domain-containing protein n=1 Tax=Brassica oleracea var. oleracea TaxID=109376 RepID=A0A0D3BRJ9_BRAOL
MEEDPLQILEKLLHLKSVVLGHRSFVGRKMVCSKGGFPQSPSSRGGRIPSSIGKLIHLRYLSLHMGWATHVPSSLRNLKLLIYLRISSRERVHLPSIFKEMVELRFLRLPTFIDYKTKLELGNLVNLECLGGFRPEYGSITDFLRLKRLRTLRLYLKGRYTSEVLASSLCELRNLEDLTLIDENNESDGAYDVDFLWSFIHLRHLDTYDKAS